VDSYAEWDKTCETDTWAQQPRALHAITRDQTAATIASIATAAKLASIAVVTRPCQTTRRTPHIHAPITTQCQLQRDINYNVNVIRWGEWLWQRNVVKRCNKNVSHEFLRIRVTHVTTIATGATRMTRVQGRHYSVDWGGHVHLTFSRRFLRLMQTRVSEWVEFNAPPDTI